MKRARFWLCLVCLLLGSAACGGDDGDSLYDGGVDAGRPSGTAGNNGAGDAGLSASGNDAGLFDEDGGFPVVACEFEAPVTACNGVPCPAADPFAAQSCRAVCCTTDNLCGLMDSTATACVAPAFTAGGCPSLRATLGGVSDTLAGCCGDLGECGGVAFGKCVDRVKLGFDAVACPDLTDADAGIGP